MDKMMKSRAYKKFIRIGQLKTRAEYNKYVTLMAARAILTTAVTITLFFILTTRIGNSAMHDNFTEFLISTAVQFAAALGLSMLFFFVLLAVQLSTQKKQYDILEKELVSDNYIQNLSKQLEKHKNVPTLYAYQLANAYIERGEFIAARDCILNYSDRNFVKNPQNALMFFTSLLEIYVKMNDIASAKTVYIDGFFYLNAYSDSYEKGCAVNYAFAIYETMLGNYDRSDEFLDKSYRQSRELISSNKKAAGCLKDVIDIQYNYTKARNCFGRGEFKDVARYLNKADSCKPRQYYKVCCDSLRSALNDVYEAETPRES